MRKIIILIILLLQLILKAKGQEVQSVLPTITDSIQANKKVISLSISSPSIRLINANKYLWPNSSVKQNSSEGYTFLLAKKKPLAFASFSRRNARWVIPALLISYGVYSKTDEDFQFVDQQIAKGVQSSIYRKFTFDNYLQYLPVASLFAIDWIGFKAKHTLTERLALSGTSYAIMAATVNVLKHTVKIARPDKSAFNSFPSGHTATAFVGAHLLFKEYANRSLWVGLSGYAVAGLTGAMRIINNRHYLSDVIAGAGIGVLSVELGYLTLPFWRRVLHIHPKKSFALAPTMTNKSAGLYFSYTF